MSLWVYILQCQDNCWYVGRTTDPENRLKDHFGASGSAWTKKHPPIRLYELIPECDPLDEDKHTKRYMIKYGISNVRGGTYCQVNLPDEMIATVQREIWSSQNLCLNCGGNHLIKLCPSSNKSSPVKSSKTKVKVLCTRCGRNTHMMDKCYAKTKINGETIDGPSSVRPPRARKVAIKSTTTESSDSEEIESEQPQFTPLEEEKVTADEPTPISLPEPEVSPPNNTETINPPTTLVGDSFPISGVADPDPVGDAINSAFKSVKSWFGS